LSHITIIINRASPSTSDEQDGVTATVTYPVPHDATDQDIARNVKRLVRQVKTLGAEEDSD
jgi:hypothetical protein